MIQKTFSLSVSDAQISQILWCLTGRLKEEEKNNPSYNNSDTVCVVFLSSKSSVR